MVFTTVAIQQDTLKLLRKAKDDAEAASFNDVIKSLLLEAKKPKKSMFGALKGVHATFKREEIDRFD